MFTQWLPAGTTRIVTMDADGTNVQPITADDGVYRNEADRGPSLP